ncbi:competence/damage-inducible protein A [Haloterrigena alkaliphila]|uniref:Competence/damage-inducible protein A n=1 Tax=Haloterrigena alkaliphila TaxID=2816475 RepID=A0A8A2V996_9EURY|nr:molybdopterin-binding protein [Haloterrigena alkaliphila]QSW98041.1 competence/damage-inducible protein A [Haloterrigena alkaliphila]
MEVGILTVGDEVLAGDIANTNARWLATRLTDSGATVDRILTLPDDRDRIAATIGEWTAALDVVIVTGGLGGTHDDVTVDALADAFERELVVDDAVRRDVLETVADYRDIDPDSVAAAELDFDVDAWAALPAGSRPLLNPEGLCPGCVIENAYAFPGVPAELKALFEQVAGEFSGDAVSRTVYTPQPEASVVDAIAGARERFDVTIGSYPDTERRNRLKVTGTDPETVDAALEWLSERVELGADE